MARQAGLPGRPLHRCCLQYGSTLRSLGGFDRSAALLEHARAQSPDSPSLAVFEAISLNAGARPDEALAALLDVVAAGVRTPDAARDKSAILGNAAHLRSLADAAHSAGFPKGR